MDRLIKTSAELAEARFSRRTMMKGAAGIVAATAIGSRVVGSASAATGFTFRTTTSVNLRASSNNTSKIIKVVPEGAKVTDYDQVLENGYRGVDYNGTTGWIYNDFLVPDAASPVAFYTTTSVNFRAGSSTSSKILKVIPANAKVLDYDFKVENGFRGVDYKGQRGWIYDQFLIRK
jgi:uncharacterized protein YgiM (DUF1202 family)